MMVRNKEKTWNIVIHIRVEDVNLFYLFYICKTSESNWDRSNWSSVFNRIVSSRFQEVEHQLIF